MIHDNYYVYAAKSWCTYKSKNASVCVVCLWSMKSVTSHCSVGCFLPLSAPMNALCYWLNFLDWSPLTLAWDLHTTWRWPCFLHFLQTTVRAGHRILLAIMRRASATLRVWSLRDLLFSTPSFWIAPMIGDVPLSSFCWDFTTSFWRIRAMAEAIVLAVNPFASAQIVENLLYQPQSCLWWGRHEDL